MSAHEPARTKPTTPDTPSPYDEGFVTHQAERLRQERRALLAEIGADEDEIDTLESFMDEAASTDEIAVALTEQELGRTLIDTARETLQHIERALRAIDADTYGWDPDNGLWIRQARLEALPWARNEILVPPEVE